MIHSETHNGALIVTIDHQDKANSLTTEMLSQMAEIAEGAGDARALILTARGKVFSAGADLDEARAGLATSPLWERLSGAIANLPCLTIAALNGTLAGGAFGMVLACDIRVAVPSAAFFYPVAKLGFLPQPRDPARLRALVGPARAKLLLMGGARISAQEALAFGLVDRLATDPLAEAHDLAGPALEAKAGHIGAIKAMIQS